MVFDKVKELIVEQLDVDEDSVTSGANIQDDLGADSLGFFKVEDLPRIIPHCKLNGFCDACFTGDYPVPVTLKEEDC